MPAQYLRLPRCFSAKKSARSIGLEPLEAAQFTGWLKKQDADTKKAVRNVDFAAKPGQAILLRDGSGQIKKAVIGIPGKPGIYDFAQAAKKLEQLLPSAVAANTVFTLTGGAHHTEVAIGWALAAYGFDFYKKAKGTPLSLRMPAKADRKRVEAFAEAIFLVRDLINTPANDMGPDELEKAARELAATFDATIRITSGAALKSGFPLVHAVGHGSPRRPRLIEFRWGNPKHPKLTLVGKGVCFDTGGLNLKPAQPMALMKKDMGGAAHVLGLARLIMGIRLPVRLRVIIPAVENSVSGESFRPGDVFTSRKGLTVENTNTDAEGRLILADALTYACEEKPDLVIDFATLTGSARVALGAEIPPMFSNADKVAADLTAAAMKTDEPVWRMPLWQPYRKIIESSIADLVNSAAPPGDLIYSALFLESFLLHGTDWVHLDVFAWENNGRAGRPKGGADTGLRAVFAYLEKRFGKG